MVCRVVPSVSTDSWHLPDKTDVTSVKSWFVLGYLLFPMWLLFEAAGQIKTICTKIKARLYRERVRNRLWPHALVMHYRSSVTECLQAVHGEQQQRHSQSWGIGYGFAVFWWRHLKWDRPHLQSFHHSNFWHQSEQKQDSDEHLSDYTETRALLKELNIDTSLIDELALPSTEVNHGVLLFVVAALDRLGWMAHQTEDRSMRIPRLAVDSWYEAFDEYPDDPYKVRPYVVCCFRGCDL